MNCSPSCSAEQAGEGTCPSPVALAGGEAALDSCCICFAGSQGIGLFLQSFGDFVLTAPCAGFVRSVEGPACINTGSGDISVTSGSGCHSRNTSFIHSKGRTLTKPSQCRWCRHFVHLRHALETAGPVLSGSMTSILLVSGV